MVERRTVRKTKLMRERTILISISGRWNMSVCEVQTACDGYHWVVFSLVIQLLQHTHTENVAALLCSTSHDFAFVSYIQPSSTLQYTHACHSIPLYHSGSMQEKWDKAETCPGRGQTNTSQTERDAVYLGWTWRKVWPGLEKSSHPRRFKILTCQLKLKTKMYIFLLFLRRMLTNWRREHLLYSDTSPYWNYLFLLWHILTLYLIYALEF